MTQPFLESDVLYRFVPTGADFDRTFWQITDEYVLVRSAGWGMRAYFRAGEQWREDGNIPHNLIIARLLRERDALAAKVEKVTAKKEHAYRAAVSDLEKAEAERDVYQEALTEIQDGYVQDLEQSTAYAALEAGRKIREGK
jgi:hypothetical protein